MALTIAEPLNCWSPVKLTELLAAPDVVAVRVVVAGPPTVTFMLPPPLTLRLWPAALAINILPVVAVKFPALPMLNAPPAAPLTVIDAPDTVEAAPVLNADAPATIAPADVTLPFMVMAAGVRNVTLGAVMLEPALELSAPVVVTSNAPVVVALAPAKLRAPVLFKNMPVEALAFTFATDDTSNLEPVPVPIDPVVEVRFN